MTPGLRPAMPASKFPCLYPGVQSRDGSYDTASDDTASDLDDFHETSVEESCKRALHHFPSPDVNFPMPALEFDFRVAVTLNPEPSRVENRVKKEITTVSAGRWSGSFGNGRVMAGGYDLGQARGFRPIRIVEGAFVMQTTDEPPAILEMRTRGSLSGPCDILDTLLSPRQPKDIDPRRYGFRMFATVKSPDKRFAEIVNCGLWIASGVWSGDELIIE
ncbi:Outer membrane protein, beta-barrel [Ophiocordyceps sinensis CO18]|uniref:Outer membrane protein, beta-barrel n=1 Tax=Ophiocordyceps sinensis (strain Co18 / CGMCC 3.14243) TaxID=911162 RepID=T5AL26_OPHSC|nr:Outer membrane protein, beta-barrel [Ophiocordyceps sinensis CO18]